MANLVDLYTTLEPYKNMFKVVYDIGASDGRSSDAMNLPLTGNPTFYLFDANDNYANQQHNYKFEYHTVLLSDNEKEVDYYSKNSSGDSYYLEFTSAYANVKPIKRTTTTLDKYRVENNIPLPDLIKIDTQGSELDILKGGIESLRHAKMVILECPVFEYNLGAPKFDEYISFMRNNGFKPHKLTEIHSLIFHDRSPDAVCQIDIAFVK